MPRFLPDLPSSSLHRCFLWHEKIETHCLPFHFLSRHERTTRASERAKQEPDATVKASMCIWTVCLSPQSLNTSVDLKKSFIFLYIISPPPFFPEFFTFFLTIVLVCGETLRFVIALLATTDTLKRGSVQRDSGNPSRIRRIMVVAEL